MRRKKRKPNPASAASTLDEAALAFIKPLERIRNREGRWYMDIFRDFLVLAELCLDRVPSAFQEAAETGKLGEDPPEIAERWAPIRARYRPESMRGFAEAFETLLDATAYPDGSLTYWDVLGVAYMQFVPSRGKGGDPRGQYFTPWNVARFMAQMVMGDVEQEAQRRLRAAIEKSEIASAAMLAVGLTSQCGDDDDAWKATAQKWWLEVILPATHEHLEPISVLDPCVGSGVMLLAAASALPRYLLDWGLVRFCGMDIDPTVVATAKLNIRLYSLNGHSVT